MAEDLLKKYTFAVDSVKATNGKPMAIAFSQGDVKTAILIINLTENDTALDLTGKKVRVSFKKSDGTSVMQDMTTGISVVDALAGKIQIELSTQALSARGNVRGQISITDEVAGLVAETAEFTFVVRESIINTSIISSDELPIIEQTLEAAAILGEVDLQTIVDNTQNVNSLKSEVETARGTAPNLSDRFSSVESSLAQNAKKLDNYTYNLDDGLRNFRRLKNPIVVNMGDSISGVPSNTPVLSAVSSNWIGQVANQFEVNYGKATVRSGDFYLTTPLTGWTQDNHGINLHRVISTDSAINLPFMLSGATCDVQLYAKVIYSTAPDGGTFDITIDGATVLTVNCNGAASDAKISAEFIIPASKIPNIVPKAGNKAYVHGWVGLVTSWADVNKPHMIANIAVGGRKLLDYTDVEIVDNVKVYNPDLYIMALGANDYSQGIDVNTYKSKVELSIQTAQGLGSDVLLLVMCGNSDTQSGGTKESLFKSYKSALLDLAKQYNCGYVSIDDAWGGYAKAKADGIIADTIHPNQNGYDLIANIIIKALLNQENVYYRLRANITKFEDMMIRNMLATRLDQTFKFWYDKMIIEVPNNNGARGWNSYVQPILSRSTATRPNKPYQGMMQFDTTLNKPIWCKTAAVVDGGGNVTTPAVWVDSTGTTV